MLELTFGELKQGLICCTVHKRCAGCPLFDEDKMQTATAGDLTCTQQLMAAAMNCINIMEHDLTEARKLASQWEEIATTHEQAVIALYESLDRRPH